MLRDFGRTSNQVGGLIKTDQQWAEKLEAALTATRRDDLQHGRNARRCLQGLPGVPTTADGLNAITPTKPASAAYAETEPLEFATPTLWSK